jgi:hypothetical protein
MVRDKAGHVPWNAQFRRCKTGFFEITARQDQRFLTCGGASPERSYRTVGTTKPRSGESASACPSGASAEKAGNKRHKQLARHSRTTTSRGDGGSIAGRARSARLIRGGPEARPERPRTNVRGSESHEVAWGEPTVSPAGVTQRESRPTSNERERTAKPRSGVGAASPRLPFGMLRSLIRPAELRLLPEASLV